MLSSSRAREVVLASNANGNLAAAWTAATGHTVEVTVALGGAWQQPTVIGPAHSANPGVSVEPNGARSLFGKTKRPAGSKVHSGVP